MAHPLQQGTKRVAIFTGATPTDGGTEVSNSNPLPVTSVSHTATDLEGGGKTSVGTTPVEVTFSGKTESINIQADASNTGTLYVGKSDVASNGDNSFRFLDASDSVEIDYDDSTNAIFVVASVASQNFWKGATI